MDDLFFIAIAVLAVGLIAGLTHIVARSLSRASAERAAFGPIDDHRQSLVRPGFILCLLSVFVIAPLAFRLLAWWPPRWLEHRQHHQQAIERVVAAGGWDSLHQDTALLLATNQGQYLRCYYPLRQTNFVLPSAIAALKPREIELNLGRSSNAACYRIFGYKSSGARGQANYWLVVTGENGSPDIPKAITSRFPSPRTIHLITNGVYEVY